MTRLSSEQALKETNTSDPNSVSSLKLTYKALSDVSCLSDFKYLERLDLSLNILTSLEGLDACVNLKWLAVVQNKLESLKGIEGLTKLTVLNAGKNKLTSMDEIKSLVSLRALILNDNEIISICKLDQMRELNTLVLSRNPILEIGESLVKVKSITKLSLSNCQLHTIGSSLKYCTELKELRLAHNSITTLPAELARNKKLQNLDLGNNVIISWSDLEVLTSLDNLKNLNLHGNPVAENDKLAKRIKKELPYLQIFNAKPTEKCIKNSDRVEDSSVNFTNNLDGPIDNAIGVDVEKKLKRKRQKTNDISSEKETLVCEDEKRGDIRKKNSKHHVVEQSKDGPLDYAEDVHVGKESRHKKQKNDKPLKKQVPVHEEVDAKVEKKLKKMKVKQGELDVIDDPEASFVELFAADTAENPKNDYEKKIVKKAIQDMKSEDGIVTISVKKKKAKSHGVDPAPHLFPKFEIGLGGPSTWGDE